MIDTCMMLQRQWASAAFMRMVPVMMQLTERAGARIGGASLWFPLKLIGYTYALRATRPFSHGSIFRTRVTCASDPTAIEARKAHVGAQHTCAGLLEVLLSSGLTSIAAVSPRNLSRSRVAALAN